MVDSKSEAKYVINTEREWESTQLTTLSQPVCLSGWITSVCFCRPTRSCFRRDQRTSHCYVLGNRSAKAILREPLLCSRR